MSAYDDFHKDFPKRCLKILRSTKKHDEFKQHNVTLILIVASAGLVIPFERLRPREINKEHPIGDREKYPDDAREIDNLMSEKILTSNLGKGVENWEHGITASISNPPDTWLEMGKRKTISHDKTVGGVIKTIRNALSHGNIYTLRDPIEHIVFAEKNGDKKYSFICVSPKDFETFMKNWFKFLVSKNISIDVAKESLDIAA
jgi:hypothetical protein